MARLVNLPSGRVFAQESLRDKFPTPSRNDALSTKDIVDILSVAEAVGKSEAVGAVAGTVGGVLKNIFAGSPEGAKSDGTKPTEVKPASPDGAKPAVPDSQVAPVAPPPVSILPPKPTSPDASVAPVAPAKPVSPDAQVAPVAPVAPAKPVSPEAQVPVAPVSPDAQVPVAPVAPVAPPAGKTPTAALPLEALPPVVKAPEPKNYDELAKVISPDTLRLASVGVNPPGLNPDGSVDLKDQERWKKEVYDKYVAEQAAASKPTTPAETVSGTTLIDEAAKAKVRADAEARAKADAEAKKKAEAAAAAAEAEAYRTGKKKVDVTIGPPEPRLDITWDMKKDAGTVAKNLVELAKAYPQKTIEKYIQQHSNTDTTESGYYQLIGILQAARENLPKNSVERNRIFIEEENLKRKMKKALEERGLSFDPDKIPSVKVAPTTLGQAEGEQGMSPYYMAGGPGATPAPQVPAPTGKRTISGEGVKVEAEKPKAAKTVRPEEVDYQPVAQPATPTAGAGAGKGSAGSSQYTYRSGLEANKALPVVGQQAGVPAGTPASPQATNLRDATVRGATLAEAAATSDLARTQEQKRAADLATWRTNVDALAANIGKKPEDLKVPKGVKDTVERALLAGGDPTAVLALAEKRLKEEDEKGAITIPPNASFQQLISLARSATTPANQAKVLAAYETARNKPPPKNLLEMYSGDNDLRNIAMIEAAFPAKAREEDAYTRQLKYAQAYKAVADGIRAVQQAEESQAAEALKTQKAYREEYEIAAGDVGAEIANKIAKTRYTVGQIANVEEKARRTAELLNLERAGLAMNVDLKAAQIDKLMAERLKAARAGGGGGGKQKGLTAQGEWTIKKDVVGRSLDDQKQLVATLQQDLQKRKAAEAGKRRLEQLKAQAIAQGAPFMQVSQYDTKIADYDAIIGSIAPEAELAAQIQLEAQTLRELQLKFADLGADITGRIPQQAHPPVSVPSPAAVGGPVEKGAAPKPPNAPQPVANKAAKPAKKP